jgi:hypothetical protein
LAKERFELRKSHKDKLNFILKRVTTIVRLIGKWKLVARRAKIRVASRKIKKALGIYITIWRMNKQH